ncbi:hypothetical protein [Sphingomonas nostoxanthinifaciens]|uniref:hypothetical protein n=1 Tax=Sphingomonas nostoxanthinifaciens TaxID=2872652 RepID=UPI001CC1E4D0|nr:hypothetical protein [Sphingomonas nostoxanthinifaciens]UAK25673.1 hypothetical protein K8P63_05900 [Sphingomonas nostoxanthinifaciens]
MAETDKDWVDRWLDAVRDGTATMSQRSRTSIDTHGGLDVAIAAAKARGVHLVQLTDDKGRLLVAASLEPFETLC